MRRSFHLNKKISPTKTAKALVINGLYKFVINGKYQATLRITDASKFTYARLLAVLATQQIIQIIQGRPCIQSSLVQIKSQKGVTALAENFDISQFAVEFPEESPRASPQQSSRKTVYHMRPTSARKKLFSSRQLDLLQSPIASTNKNKMDVSMSINLEQSPNRSNSFRLRRTPSATRRQTEMRSSQLIRESIATFSNQSEKDIEQSSPASSQKIFRRRSNSKFTLKRPRLHQML